MSSLPDVHMLHAHDLSDSNTVGEGTCALAVCLIFGLVLGAVHGGAACRPAGYRIPEEECDAVPRDRGILLYRHTVHI